MIRFGYIDVPAYVILVILGIIVCFWGKQLSRIISSIVFGAFLGYITWIYTFKLWSSIALSLVSTLIAMIAGFVIGFIAFRLVVSVVFAYIFASILLPAKDITFFVLITVFTTMIYVVSNFMLSLLYASAGALMVYEGVTTLGLEKSYSLVVCLVIFILGLYNQFRARV